MGSEISQVGDTMSVETIASFLAGVGPLVDVRAPAEYRQGHIPGAINLPLFSDAERAQVGIAYKQQGRQQAVQLGLELVGPRLGTLAGQLGLIAETSDQPLRLYCWRGGMRSASVGWLAGVLELPHHRLEGGYKAFRHWVLERFEQPWPLLLLGGRTGCGKTDILLQLEALGSAVIDLEGLAQHRGSSFGGLGLPEQPSSEHFENRLAVELHQLADRQPIWLEAESAQVGRCRIPAGLWSQMQRAPVVELQRPLEERVERLVVVYGDQGQEALREATSRIARRLGPQRTATALEAIERSDWAEACRQMLDYYDRCYDHELAKRQPDVLFSLPSDQLGDGPLATHLFNWESGECWGNS